MDAIILAQHVQILTYVHRELVDIFKVHLAFLIAGLMSGKEHQIALANLAIPVAINAMVLPIASVLLETPVAIYNLHHYIILV